MNPSEPDFWRERYLLRDTPWDKGRAHPALEAWLRENPVSHDSRVLVPGAGAGHDVRCWAKAGAHAVGLDVVPEAVSLAREFTAEAGIANCEFITGSIFDPPQHLLGDFDFVFEHTCFCAFDPANRPDYARAVSALLRPGGKFLAIFYMRPDHDEGPPFGCEEKELFELFGADFLCSCREIARPTFEGREEREEIWLWKRTS